MKSEQVAFGQRLRAALKANNQSQSPKEIAGLLPRFGGTPVTDQAVSGWLTGKSLPRRPNLVALARMLRMEADVLEYGSGASRKVQEPTLEWKISAVDRLAVDAFLALPAPRRKLIRELIDQLSDH
ncbi:MAG: hypothetical protein JSR70_00260 [Proteobacteria bacterium]|nr:hypothetical protein [Pseudomonadota bacterium]